MLVPSVLCERRQKPAPQAALWKLEKHFIHLPPFWRRYFRFSQSCRAVPVAVGCLHLSFVFNCPQASKYTGSTSTPCKVGQKLTLQQCTERPGHWSHAPFSLLPEEVMARGDNSWCWAMSVWREALMWVKCNYSYFSNTAVLSFVFIWITATS